MQSGASADVPCRASRSSVDEPTFGVSRSTCFSTGTDCASPSTSTSSSATTGAAGAPYPAKDVVHRYADAHTTVQHRVVVTWTAQWSLNGGPLRPVNGTVTTSGPATPLRIAEASPALSGAGYGNN